MGKKISILVVDDDQEIGFMVKLMLEHKGFSVVVLERDEAVEKTIFDNAIDLVMLDMLIAGVKGTDICLRLKSNPAFIKLPVIIVTALPNAEQLCIQAGANDFLAKPFEMVELIAKIKKLVPSVESAST